MERTKAERGTGLEMSRTGKEQDWGRNRTGGETGLEEKQDWRRNRSGGGRGLGEEEDWGRKRTGGGTGLEEEQVY